MPTFEATRTWEDDLLSEIEAAFAPTELHPPEETVTALRAAVACIPSQPVRRRQALPWRRRRWAAAGAVVAAVVAGPGIAFAAGAPVPPVVRDLANTIGLPVTPQPVVNAQNASSALRGLLRTGSPNPESVAAAGRQLSTEYRQLNPPQQAQLGASTPQLLQRACRYVLNVSGPFSAKELQAWPGCRSDLAGQGSSQGTVPAGSGQGSRSGAGVAAPGKDVTSGGPGHGQTGTGGAGGAAAPTGGRAGISSSGPAPGAGKSGGSAASQQGPAAQPERLPGSANSGGGGTASGSGARGPEGAQPAETGQSLTVPGNSNGVASSVGRSSAANG